MKIHTTKGAIDECLLQKKSRLVDNENETTTWIEYWLEGELVHRSVTVQLKKPVAVFGETASIG